MRRADFEKENQGFVDRFREYFPEFTEGHVLDLGCGPGDIPVRFARAFPSCRITGVDASEPMVRLAEETVQQAGLSGRITFRCERFQDFAGANIADAAISNSLLHHVPNPLQFWHKLRLAVKPGSPVLVMDLLETGLTGSSAGHRRSVCLRGAGHSQERLLQLAARGIYGR